MIKLHEKESGTFIGDISEDQLQFLIDQLEEESDDDQDYYINPATLDLFKEKGIDAALLSLLKQALGNRAEMEIEWTKD